MRDELQIGKLRVHGAPAGWIHVTRVGGIAAVDKMAVFQGLPGELHLLRCLGGIQPEQLGIYGGGILHVVAPAMDRSAGELRHDVGMLRQIRA